MSEPMSKMISFYFFNLLIKIKIRTISFYRKNKKEMAKSNLILFFWVVRCSKQMPRM